MIGVNSKSLNGGADRATYSLGDLADAAALARPAGMQAPSSSSSQDLQAASQNELGLKGRIKQLESDLAKKEGALRFLWEQHQEVTHSANRQLLEVGERLKKSDAQGEARDCQILRLKEVLAASEAEKASKDTEVQKLWQKLSAARAEIGSECAKNQSLNKQTQELWLGLKKSEAKWATKGVEILRLRDRLAASEAERAGKDTEVQKLRKKLAVARAEIGSKRAENQSLQEQLAALQEESQSKEQTIQVLLGAEKGMDLDISMPGDSHSVVPIVLPTAPVIGMDLDISMPGDSHSVVPIVLPTAPVIGMDLEENAGGNFALEVGAQEEGGRELHEQVGLNQSSKKGIKRTPKVEAFLKLQRDRTFKANFSEILDYFSKISHRNFQTCWNKQLPENLQRQRDGLISKMNEYNLDNEEKNDVLTTLRTNKAMNNWRKKIFFENKKFIDAGFVKKYSELWVFFSRRRNVKIESIELRGELASLRDNFIRDAKEIEPGVELDGLVMALRAKHKNPAGEIQKRVREDEPQIEAAGQPSKKARTVPASEPMDFLVSDSEKSVKAGDGFSDSDLTDLD